MEFSDAGWAFLGAFITQLFNYLKDNRAISRGEYDAQIKSLKDEIDILRKDVRKWQDKYIETIEGKKENVSGSNQFSEVRVKEAA